MIVLFDGGVWCGSDIVKVFVLGVDVVLLGRVFFYGLVVWGCVGVFSVFLIFEDEMCRIMIFMGCYGVLDLFEVGVVMLVKDIGG